MTVTIPGPQIRALGTVQQLADDYAGQAKAPRTVRAYATDWRDFVSWTDAHRRQALPAEPDTVAMYLADLAAHGVRPSTLSRRRPARREHRCVEACAVAEAQQLTTRVGAQESGTSSVR